MTINNILDEFDYDWNGVDDDYRKDATKWLKTKLTELVDSVPDDFLNADDGSDEIRQWKEQVKK